jgi:hypothetical protein
MSRDMKFVIEGKHWVIHTTSSPDLAYMNMGHLADLRKKHDIPGIKYKWIPNSKKRRLCAWCADGFSIGYYLISRMLPSLGHRDD